MSVFRVSHPDPDGPPDRTPIEVGEVWANAVTGERAVIVERPWDNAGLMVAELTALVGARVTANAGIPPFWSSSPYSRAS